MSEVVDGKKLLLIETLEKIFGTFFRACDCILLSINVAFFCEAAIIMMFLSRGATVVATTDPVSSQLQAWFIVIPLVLLIIIFRNRIDSKIRWLSVGMYVIANVAIFAIGRADLLVSPAILLISIAGMCLWARFMYNNPFLKMGPPEEWVSIGDE